MGAYVLELFDVNLVEAKELKGEMRKAVFEHVPIERVQDYWNRRPCNIRHSPKPVGTREYFDEVEARKYFVEPRIPRFVDFPRWKGKKCWRSSAESAQTRSTSRATARRSRSRALGEVVGNCAPTSEYLRIRRERALLQRQCRSAQRARARRGIRPRLFLRGHPSSLPAARTAPCRT